MEYHRIRPGTGRGHPSRRGGIGWELKRQNELADDGFGFVYALTRMGGLACDLIKIGQTRNHPASRAETIYHKNLSDHWRHEREIRSAHRSDPPQLWASFSVDRKADERAVHQKLVEFCLLFNAPDIQTVLAVMSDITGKPPERYPFVGPARSNLKPLVDV